MSTPEGRTVLVIGGGGREHALAWKLAASPHTARVLVAPGNAGTAAEPGVVNVPVAATDVEGLLRLARAEAVDLCVVGPEAALVAGVTDAFEAAGIRCFGPRRAAAELEGSKAFCKDFMARHGIPTARYGRFSAPGPAIEQVRQWGAPIVVKASGLAAGKGVVVAASEDQAVAAIEDMFAGGYGEAGREVVVEEFLEGEEASFIVMADGERVLPLASSQDHKARDEGDRGPNTGGMGAYSPAPVVDEAMHARIMRRVIEPTLRGLAAEGRPYRGFLYAGVMIGPDGEPRVLEFNCRLGDPETQPLLMRLRSDLLELCEAAFDDRLDGMRVDWDPRTALGVVLTAGGYPGPSRKDDPIEGLQPADGPAFKVFHAGTALRGDGAVVTAGGRVLCVCALGSTVEQARRLAYARVGELRFAGMYYRRDIGYRALARQG